MHEAQRRRTTKESSVRSDISEILRRVTLQPNGTYIWSGELDMDVEQKNYRNGGLIWVSIAAVIFLIGVFYLCRTHSWQPFLYITGFVIVILLITYGVVGGQGKMGQMRRTYRLMDELIASGSGRRTAVFDFRKAKVMILGKRYIELQGTVGAFRAYVPKEELRFC